MSDINKSIAMWEENLSFPDFSYSNKLVLEHVCIGLIK